MGLPVVFGEVADQVQPSYEKMMAQIAKGGQGALADLEVYHYYPALDQVRAWLKQEGLGIEEEGTGLWYQHFLARSLSERETGEENRMVDFANEPQI